VLVHYLKVVVLPLLQLELVVPHWTLPLQQVALCLTLSLPLFLHQISELQLVVLLQILLAPLLQQLAVVVKTPGSCPLSLPLPVLLLAVVVVVVV
jgi:hypothetical protein